VVPVPVPVLVRARAAQSSSLAQPARPQALAAQPSSLAQPVLVRAPAPLHDYHHLAQHVASHNYTFLLLPWRFLSTSADTNISLPLGPPFIFLTLWHNPKNIQTDNLLHQKTFLANRSADPRKTLRSLKIPKNTPMPPLAHTNTSKPLHYPSNFIIHGTNQKNIQTDNPWPKKLS
jgi:hypothetical protein